MNITNKSKETIDACRFCWMCRHICPIGMATGQERHNPRARALALSLVERGAEKLEDVAENLYECSLCGACTADCLTGWDPPAFTLNVRREAAMDGILPDYIVALVKRVLEKGNAFGTDIDKQLLGDISALGQSDTLLYLGEAALFKSPESARGAIRLLKRAKVDFTVLKDEYSSGYSLNFLTGNTAETVESYKKCASLLNKYKTVIVYDGNDLKTIVRDYRESGIEVTAKVVGFHAYVAELVSSGKIRVKDTGKSYTLQDSSALARDIEDYSAYSVLEKIGKRHDMLLKKRDTVFAGSLLMNEYMPNIMCAVAKRRIDDAIKIEAKTIVTCDVSEFQLLKENNCTDIEILSFEQAIEEAMI